MSRNELALTTVGAAPNALTQRARPRATYTLTKRAQTCAALLCVIKYLLMKPRIARRLLALAAILGIAADSLLRESDGRAGFVVWILLVLGGALTVSQSSPTAEADDTGDAAASAANGEVSARRERRTLYAAAGVLALLLILRDAPMLYALNCFAFVVTLFLVAWRAHGKPLAQLQPRDALIGVASAVAAGAGGGPMLVLRDRAATVISEHQRRAATYFAIGAVVAMPVLLLVTGLLAASDPMFAGFLEEIGSLLELHIVGHVVLIVAATWLTAGALRGSLRPVGINASTLRGRLDLPFSAVAPVLGGLSLLLSVWIGLQVRTLFGGTPYIAATTGVTAADYARSGFFELIVIAGIVLAVLLLVDDLLHRDDSAQRRLFHTVGRLLVTLVAAVVVSAVMRLALYLNFYGLTDDRVLALAVLVWVALVLTWFAMTVLRGARTRFAPGVLVVSALWLGALNIINPERWVVEHNVQRAEAGLEFDVAYHAQLSGDALPSLRRAADRLGAEHAAALRNAVELEWAQRTRERADWRSWSLPYWRATK